MIIYQVIKQFKFSLDKGRDRIKEQRDKDRTCLHLKLLTTFMRVP